MRTLDACGPALVALMVLQAAMGVAMPAAYRDPDWIRATWWGNDWFTLVVAVPIAAWARSRRARSSRADLIWAGLAGYAVYNYAFYLLGAALNAFLPLYVGLLILAVASLVGGLARVSVESLALALDDALPARAIGGYFATVGLALTAVWLGLWGAYVFAGRPTPVEPQVFKVVAALDLSLMVPALIGGGVLLWRRRPWGVAVRAVAGVQGALYLTVLAVNSVVLARRGLGTQPGELVIWAPLAICTSVAAILLLLRVPSIHR